MMKKFSKNDSEISATILPLQAVEYLFLWKENATLNVAKGTKTWEPTSCAAVSKSILILYFGHDV